jgi:fructose-bisphosphate aldolase class II
MMERSAHVFQGRDRRRQGICASRFEAFGSAGQASKIKVMPLERMAQRYVAGELDAVVH